MVIRRLFEIFLLIVVAEGCCLASDYPEARELSVDIGGNITLPCSHESNLDVDAVMWVRKGRTDEQISRLKILSDGSLSLNAVDKEDTGEYLCHVEDQTAISIDSEEIPGHELQADNDIKSHFIVSVKTPPPALVNVSIHPSTVLALLLWDVADDGGYEITHFSAQYRLKYGDDWHEVLPKRISPTVRHIDVYRLKPNSTYTFQIWANNALGAGEGVILDGTTRHVTEEIELARHLLEGAETFDTRIWVVAVAVVMGTLVLLSVGTCYLLCKDYDMPAFASDEEVIELVPNIILNPGYYDAELTAPTLDENFNDQMPIHLNNNTRIPRIPMAV